LHATGAGPSAPVFADLTGDGVPDLATADATGNDLSLLRNAGAPAPAGALDGAFGAQAVGTTGVAHAITITDNGAARLGVTGVATAGPDADDFLITGDGCTGTSVKSGGADACTVRVRFAPSASGARAATLRVRYGTAGATFDVPLSGTGGVEDDDAQATTASTTATTTTTAVATPVPAATTAAEPVIPPMITTQPKVKKSTKLILTLSHATQKAKPGAAVKVGFALGRAAKLVLRVKHGGRTVDIVRASERGGRGTIVWDGKLGKQAAVAGSYRLDVYAVAADGRAARGSVVLTIKG
jgi:hypothetical protein